MDSGITTITDENPCPADESEIDVLIKVTDSMHLGEQFTADVSKHLKDSNSCKLKELYDMLAEVEDVEKGKRTCFELYVKCFEEMEKIIKDDTSNKMMRYYVWHFVQLMTCCPQVREVMFLSHHALNLLFQLNKCEWTEDQMLSLKQISLNYVLVMLADAPDEYFEYIETTDVIPFLYKTLEISQMNSSDTLIELTLLALNLLLEGSCGCKQKLIEFDFKTLLSTKIEERQSCGNDLLIVAKQTYEKLLLLGSENQSFVETFRYNCQEQLKKNTLYGFQTCANKDCNYSSKFALDISEINLKHCARCKAVSYCSKECQLIHWKEFHSKTCKKSS